MNAPLPPRAGRAHDLPLLRRRLRADRAAGRARRRGDRGRSRRIRRISAALCSKGSALGETLGLDGRLLHPHAAAGRRHARARRLGRGARSRRATASSTSSSAHGPDAVAFYLSGQLLTEDYYVANKLMKGFIGSANVDTNSRLCMASSVAGHRRAFGADTVPGTYADLDQADLIVLVGSNAAWCHPVLFQRMVQQQGASAAPRIVVIDPRRTATARGGRPVPADRARHRHGAVLRPARRISPTRGALDRDYIDAHTTGFDDALARAREIAPDVAATARATGLRRRRCRALLRSVPRATQRVVTCYSQGVNQSAQGTDKVNAIINCHLATGRIGRPGMGPFSLTGQPNAMGGREVGGLANQLAAHMGFTPPEIDRVRRFWNAPRMATREGLKAVQMFEAIARGEIKALWVMATNPAVSLPRAGAVREALKKLELFVVSENVRLERHRECRRACAAAGRRLGREGRHRHQFRAAHLAPARLPAAAGRGEARLVDRHRGRAAHGLCATRSPIARPPTSSASTPRCRRSRTTARAISISAALATLSDDGLRRARAGAMAACARASRAGETRFFADGGFFTPDRKARFIAPEPPALREATIATHFRSASTPAACATSGTP